MGSLPATCQRALLQRLAAAPSSRDVRIGLVWVRFRRGIVKVVAPPGAGGDIEGDEGAEAVAAPRPSWVDTSGRVERWEEGQLQVLRQQSYDDGDIEMMVRPNELALELARHELRCAHIALLGHPPSLVRWR